MMQALRNGWEHPWTTLAGLALSGLHLYQTAVAPSNMLVAGLILILGWVTTHPLGK